MRFYLFISSILRRVAFLCQAILPPRVTSLYHCFPVFYDRPVNCVYYRNAFFWIFSQTDPLNLLRNNPRKWIFERGPQRSIIRGVDTQLKMAGTRKTARLRERLSIESSVRPILQHAIIMSSELCHFLSFFFFFFMHVR